MGKIKFRQSLCIVMPSSGTVLGQSYEINSGTEAHFQQIEGHHFVHNLLRAARGQETLDGEHTVGAVGKDAVVHLAKRALTHQLLHDKTADRRNLSGHDFKR